MSLVKINLALTDKQLRALANHKSVLIKPHQVQDQAYSIHVEPKTHASITNKAKKGKGHILKLSPTEHDANIEMVGGRITWKSIGRTLRKAGKAVGKVYREHIRPVVGEHLRKAVKEGVKKVVPLALNALTTAVAPEIAPITRPVYENLGERLSEPATQGLSRLTGAYGLTKKHPKTSGMYFEHFAHQEFLPTNHQALHPLPVLPDQTGSGLFMSGGKGLYLKGGGLFLKGTGTVKQPVIFPDHSPKY